MSQPILSCQNLCMHFQDGLEQIVVLDGVDITVAQGDSIAIMGASGSGKSTLLHILGGLDKPVSGTVQVHGKNIHQVSQREQGQLRNRHLGFVYQFHHLLPEMDALENVAMPLLIRGESSHHCKQKAYDLLDRVGLSNRLHHRLAELSGGERQRVALARALVSEPQCVLADEPTGNLDAETADAMLDLMLEVKASLGTAFILVTHDPSIAKRMQRRFVLQSGQLIPD
jgi:lipoprotein-releasing system ATP-binding protein